MIHHFMFITICVIITFLQLGFSHSPTVVITIICTAISVFLNLLFAIFQIFETVFYIAIDHQSQSVVIAVRGTLSLNVSLCSFILPFYSIYSFLLFVMFSFECIAQYIN